MSNHDENSNNDSYLDKRLGAPMKKIDGLSSDKKKAESEHLHAFREDVDKDENNPEKKE
ncbi:MULTISPECIES: hypothetical protein [Dysgonomonas]|uniref:Uncharacterized protein n=1 Tax=Dysgonomonas gadei ATCC BAA-286 TaxID=742766 RepID=F5IV05_9BACT|nr:MULTISPECIES: hypothetical protein [Dysgonomonas]EGK03055.1 hypothetical protein HMPREF9455_01305 [Dysgonomonas gadei ATCC BAA-286]MBF0648892.1 hypothetical protein [Dysgonomonas sp. GY75]